MVCFHFSLSCARSNLVFAEVASALPLDTMTPSSALPVHCACAVEAANKAHTKITTVDRRRTERPHRPVRSPGSLTFAQPVWMPAKQLADNSDKIPLRCGNPPRRSTQVIAHLAVRLA